jgi:hypothetical protein
MMRNDADVDAALRARIHHARPDLGRPVPSGPPQRSLRPLGAAIALAATLSAVLGVTTALTHRGHDATQRSAAGPVRVPAGPKVATPPPASAPASLPSPALSTIPAGGLWLLYGPGEQATEIDAAGWDGRRAGVLHVAPTSNIGGQGHASFDGRHVIDASGIVWGDDGRYEGSASGASAWGDDSRTLCGVRAPKRPQPGSTPDATIAPVVFFTTVAGGDSVDVATFTPAGSMGDARILACGTGEGSIIAYVFSNRGSSSLDEVVRIHKGVATTLLPPMEMTGAAYLSAVATPDGRTLAYSKNDGRVSLMDVATGRVRTLPLSGGADALSWNGKRLLMELPLPRESLMAPTVPGLVLVDTANGAIVWRSPNHDAMDTMTLPRPGSDDIAVSLNTHGASTGVFPTSILRLVIIRADGRQVVVADNAWLIGPR